MSYSQLSTTKWLFPWLLLPMLGLPVKVLAHGVNIVYEKTEAIQITATYDQGEPLAQAQVVIYTPEDPAQVWLKGETDDQGKFTFVPDPQKQGNWDIKVRQAGHGHLISIPTENTMTQASENSEAITVTESTTPNPSPSYTSLQKVVMAASGVWGFVGTAFFFSRKRR